MLGFINKNKILAFFPAMAATQTLLYHKFDPSFTKIVFFYRNLDFPLRLAGGEVLCEAALVIQRWYRDSGR